MREIKFRAWDDNEKQMYENVQNSDFDAFLNSGSYDIMQFTGLLDRHGKEIYEGDIVKFRSHPAKMVNAQVIYDEPSARFMASYEGGWHSFQHYNNLEIIGNIYENPELIK